MLAETPKIATAFGVLGITIIIIAVGVVVCLFYYFVLLSIIYLCDE